MRIATISIALAVLAAAGVFAGCTKSEGTGAQPPKSEAAAAQPAAPAEAKAAVAQADGAPDKVVAYYFHGNRRCRTCVGIQETIGKAIQERFAAETASGVLSFVEINYEQPENQHYVKEYNLSFSTLVVAAQQGQKTVKWENCGEVWNHALNPDALSEYTETNIRGYLAMLGAK